MALTEMQQKFIDEAKAGYFLVGIDDAGCPYAMGADRAGILFSMRVREEPDVYPGESVYYLDE